MSKFTSQPVLDEVKNLISYTISNSENNKNKFEELHCSILERYFDARDVKINYMTQSIDLDLPMSNKNYTRITFECLELNNFLQSCLKSDPDSIYFYQNLLSDYKVITAA